MNTLENKTPENKNHSGVNERTHKSKTGDSTFQFADNRQETTEQRELNKMANHYTEKNFQNENRPIQLKPKWKTSSLKERAQTTANQVWSAEIQKGLIKKKKASGIAKKQSRVNDPTPDSAINVGAVTTNKGEALPENPRMLARQVTSWKLAKRMNLHDLHAKERYVNHGSDLYGVSEFFEGGQTIEDMALENPEKLTEVLQEPGVQKQLSDLQLFDFIAGQSDRHLGNIMIGPNNTVKGIDNDQAFPAENKRQNLANNQVNSFTKNNDEFKFTQQLIDHETANTVKGMTRQDLIAVFNKGSEGNETLNDNELNATEQRLQAVKARIAELEEQQQIVGAEGGMQWGPDSYQAALNTGITQGAINDDRGTNNVWRSMRKIAQADQMVQEEDNQRKAKSKKVKRGQIPFN